jgi:hypothetical protein
MTTPLQLEQSRTYPATVEAAYAAVLGAPLERIFSRRFAAIPPIREVRGQAGAWGSVGQTRQIVLADGGTMREELTSVVAGRSFHYRITDVTGVMKPLVSSADGSWTFEPAGTGVRITWAWTVVPGNAAAELAMPLFGWLWRGYARLALTEIETLLLSAPR